MFSTCKIQMVNSSKFSEPDPLKGAAGSSTDTEYQILLLVIV